MHVVILVLSLLLAIAFRFPNMPPLPLATRLRATLTITSPISLGLSHQGSHSSQRQVWKMTNAVIAILPKLRLHDGLHTSNKAFSGLVQKRRSPSSDTTIWPTCTLAERTFLLSPTLPK